MSTYPLNSLFLLLLISNLSIAASYPPNIDYGSQGDFVAKRGVTHGRTANLTPIGPILLNMPEAPGSSDGGGVVLESYNTAWDLSDLTNPTLISRISLGLTQPIGAHGTTYYFDDAYAYLFTFGTEVGGVGGSHVRYDADGATSLQQLVPTDSYDLQPNYYSSGFAGEPLGYSMMTSPYNNRAYWEYGFDPSGLYNITNPVTFDTDPNNSAPWVGPLITEWDHLGNTGVTGFTAYLGELMIVASDQQSTGLAIYNVAGVKAGEVPQLISTFKPTLTEPSGNEIGIGGYWLEPYGANKMVWAARQRDEVTPVRTHPALYVVDFTDPSNPVLTCELYFNQDHSDPSDGDSSSDPMYVNFQDNYAFVDHFKVDIPGCERAYLDDQNVSAEEFSSIVYKFEDRANHCDASQYFRPLGQVGVFGGYDGAAAAIVSYSGSEQMRDGATYMEVGAFDAWADADFADEVYPESLLITHHYEPNVAGSTREALSAGDEVLDVNAYWETGERVIFTLTDIIVDERVNEQGMCFFVTSDEADTTPPYISGHRPLAGQVNYPVDAFIHLHIPETLRAETVTHAVTVTNLSNNELVAFRHQLSHTGTLAVWPEANFDTDTTYQVDVSGIQDYMGNTMLPYSFVFTTGDGTIAPPVDPEPPVAPAPSVDEPYYPNHSGQIACESGDEYDSIWVVNPDNDSVSLLYTYTDPETFEQTIDVENDAFVFTNSNPSSVARVGEYVAVTYSDTDMLRFNRVGWWGTSPYTAWGLTFKYGSRPVASVAHGDMLYVALYGSGEIAKINTVTKQIVSLLKVGSKPKAMALTSDGSRLLVTRFISDKEYAEVYDINTAGNMSFRDEEQPSIRINKVRVPDDIDHGSGVPNYLRSIVIGPNDNIAYVTANKANVDRGLFLNGQALDDDNTIRPMIAVLDLINHQDTNTDPLSRSNTIDLDNSADPSGITFLPDGVTRAHALQGNNVVEFNNLAQNTGLRVNSGFAPQTMCTTVRSLYVKNFTDRTVSVIDTSGFMYDGRQSPNVHTLVTVDSESEVKTAEELRGLQVFYHARSPDISPEGYMSCASCHDDGGHDGMTWDLTHMGEGLRNTLSLRGASGTRFGNLHWSSNFDEVQDFEAQLEHLNGAEGLIPGQTFTELVSPISYTTSGASSDLDALAAYVSSLGKESVLRSPNSCYWGGRCSAEAHSGGWQFVSHGCVDCHMKPSFRDGENHDVGTIKPSSGQRLGSPLTEIRTPTLIELWDTAPYFHDGSAATLEDVMSIGSHAEMGLDEREQRNLIQYLLNLDRLDYIDDEDPVPADNEAPVITISGYEAGETINLQVGVTFSLPSATGFDGVDGEVDVTVSSDLDMGVADTYTVTYSAVDNAGNEASVTLTIIVSTVTTNTPPVGTDDQFTTNAGETLVLPFASILENDIDVDGDSLTVLIVDDWAGGIASIDSVARTVTFTPDMGFTGIAQFTYALTDGNDGGDYGLMAFAIVRIDVGGGVPPVDTIAPIITIVGYTSGDTSNVIVGQTFVEPIATAEDNVDGVVNVTSASDVDTTVAGTYSVMYSAIDSAGNTATAILNVVVTIFDITAPSISITGYTDGDTINVSVGGAFTPPRATAQDNVDGMLEVLSNSNVNIAVAGNYSVNYSVSDAAGNTAIASINVVVSEVGAPTPMNSVRQYTFNHSLWEHNSATNAVTGYWIGELANAGGTTYAWNGQFGQLDYHTQGYYDDLNMGPTPQLGSTNSADVYPSENTHFRNINIDNIIIMPPNFIQGASAAVAPIDIEYAQRVIDYVSDESESGGQQSEAIVYIYEHWQEASTYPLNPTQWVNYHEVTQGSYHQWFVNYQNALVAARPNVDLRMIPVGPIIADILQNTSLAASDFSFSDLYEDEAPHGEPNLYFLAGLITYQAMYGQVASNSYVPPISSVNGVSVLIANDFVALNNFVWQRLNYYNANGVRIWP
ncbi:hypothetical protein IMCC1989_2240 [gamma proteobacterium IMCC1989]|nr:hypothetical protein IMCC1989_2240 [gamma proteobacterium IMCC1989]